MQISYEYIGLIWGYLSALVVSAAIIPFIRAVAVQRKWVDRPDGKRKVHDRPTPTVGGLGIAAGFVGAFLYFFLLQNYLPLEIAVPPALFWIGGFTILAVGFYDDVAGINFKTKFLFQFVVAYLLLHAGYRIDMDVWWLAEMDVYSQALYSIPLTLFWIVGVINAVNLIDGLDGLAGGTVMIAFFCLALIFGMNGNPGLAMLSFLMVGALAGFLIYNYKPASIFMGDCGSLFTGFVFAALTLHEPIHGNTVVALLVPVVLLGLPLLDTGLAFIRRLASGRAVCAADSDHIHHRLRQQMSESQTVNYLYGAELFFAVGAVAMTIVALEYVAAIVSVLILATGFGLYLPGYIPSPVRDIGLNSSSPKYSTSEGDSLGVGEYDPNGEKDPPVVQEPALSDSAGQGTIR